MISKIWPSLVIFLHCYILEYPVWILGVRMCWRVHVCWELVNLQHVFCNLTLIFSAFSRYLRAQRSFFSLETSPSPARSRMKTFPMATSTFSTGRRSSTAQSPPLLSSKLLKISTSKLEKVCTRVSKFSTKLRTPGHTSLFPRSSCSLTYGTNSIDALLPC